jgi:hypothetical protein
MFRAICFSGEDLEAIRAPKRRQILHEQQA